MKFCEGLMSAGIGFLSIIVKYLKNNRYICPLPPKVEGSSDVPASDVLIGQGISFLGSLMKTLKDPDATKRLVDTLVKDNSVTGQASINIPVSNKETVMQFVSLLGSC